MLSMYTKKATLQPRRMPQSNHTQKTKRHTNTLHTPNSPIQSIIPIPSRQKTYTRLQQPEQSSPIHITPPRQHPSISQRRSRRQLITHKQHHHKAIQTNQSTMPQKRQPLTCQPLTHNPQIHYLANTTTSTIRINPKHPHPTSKTRKNNQHHPSQ